MIRRHMTDIHLPCQLADRCDTQEDGIQHDVEQAHKHRAHGDSERHIPLRMAHFIDDVSGGIPAGIGIHHEDQTDRKRRTGDELPITFGGQKTHGLRFAHETTSDDENQDEQHLQPCGHILKTCPDMNAPRVNEGHQKYNGQRHCQRRHTIRDASEVFPQRHRSESDGGRKANSGRKPACDKPNARMKSTGEEVILAPRTRHGSGQLAISQRTTKSTHSTYCPEHDDDETRRQVSNLEAQAREDACADHIGDDDGRGRDQGHTLSLSWSVERAHGRRFFWLRIRCQLSGSQQEVCLPACYRAFQESAVPDHRSSAALAHHRQETESG
jgi:hypothetical protein